MSYYYLYNPKIYIDPGWAGISSDAGFKRKISNYTPETQEKTENLIKSTAKVAFLEPNNKNKALSTLEHERKKVADMQEEEDVAIFLLLN